MLHELLVVVYTRLVRHAEEAKAEDHEFEIRLGYRFGAVEMAQ